MERLSSLFARPASGTACRRCKAMCGTREGLQALVSMEGYEHYSFKVLANHSKKGCLMCAKILEALKGAGIEDEPGNPGWLNFFAIDIDRRRIQSGQSSGEELVSFVVRSMRYLVAEGPRKTDRVIFLLCSSEG